MINIDYLHQLLLHPKFTYCTEKRKLYYETNPLIDFNKIRRYFTIDNIANMKDELVMINHLKNATIDALSFGGQILNERKYDHLDYLSIIDVAKENGDKLNCRYISFIFAQLLIACGFQARWVGCLPMDSNDKECHCVTEVFSRKMNKWFVVDIAFNYLYFDSKGIVLNLLEMRKNMISGDKIRFISKDKSNVLNTLYYLQKNLFKFRFAKNYTYNTTLNTEKYILLHPENYYMDVAEQSNYFETTSNSHLFW